MKNRRKIEKTIEKYDQEKAGGGGKEMEGGERGEGKGKGGKERKGKKRKEKREEEEKGKKREKGGKEATSVAQKGRGPRWPAQGAVIL